MAIYGINSYNNINMYNQISKTKNQINPLKDVSEISKSNAVENDKKLEMKDLFDISDVEDIIGKLSDSEQETKTVSDVSKIMENFINKSKMEFDSNNFSKEKLNPDNISQVITRLKTNDIVNKYKSYVQSPHLNGKEKSMSMIL